MRCKKYKKYKNGKKCKKIKSIKYAKKNIVAGVVVIDVDVVVVVVVDLHDLVLLLQSYYHAKSGGCSFKIDRVMANLVQLKFWQRTHSLTDRQISPLYSSEISEIPEILEILEIPEKNKKNRNIRN